MLYIAAAVRLWGWLGARVGLVERVYTHRHEFYSLIRRLFVLTRRQAAR